jgi:esterase/lipase superfamily enzyme
MTLKEEYFKWYTNYLDRDFEMLVFGHSGCPVILFPRSKGRYYQNKDFKLIDSVVDLIDAGKVKIYCPDGVDSQSWYNYSITPANRVKTHIGYENVILNDVVRYIKDDMGDVNIAAAGCSFGAYHAANLAFRHPDLINSLICMGGVYDIKRFIYGYYDENCYFNNPPDYLPSLNDRWYLEKIKKMNIIIGTGEQDICLSDNVHLSNILNDKGIKHWLDVRQGVGHDWQWWREMFPYYLSKIIG